MSKKANPAVVGGFVIGAITLSIIGIMLLGGKSIFDDNFKCILFFEESISGLDIGAPVEYQGVRVGTVTDVWIEVDPGENAGIYRPVIMEIEGRRIYSSGGIQTGQRVGERMDELVTRHGLRARVASQSMLTGKLKIELGNYPDQAIRRRNRDPELWEMPTIDSPMRRVAQELAQMPISDIVNETHRALQRLSELLDPEVSGTTLRNLNGTMMRLESLLTTVDENLEPLMKNLTKATEEFTLMLDADSPVRAELYVLAEDVRRAVRSFQSLTDYLEQHPESILRGKRE
jgi:paraquat-inducible protein B